MNAEKQNAFPDSRCHFSYPSAKITLISTALLIHIAFIHLESCCKGNYPINFFNISISLDALPCCLFPLRIASNTSCSFHLQGCSLVIPLLFISYFLYDKSQISPQCQPSINTCQIFKEAEKCSFLTAREKSTRQ